MFSHGRGAWLCCLSPPSVIPRERGWLPGPAFRALVSLTSVILTTHGSDTEHSGLGTVFCIQWRATSSWRAVGESPAQTIERGYHHACLQRLRAPFPCGSSFCRGNPAIPGRPQLPG